VETITYDKSVYGLNAVKKAAYKFIDRFAANIREEESQFIAEISFSKDISSEAKAHLLNEFSKEVLDQDLRENIKKETEGYSKFQPITFYKAKADVSYSLLPFKFTRFDNDRVLVTNMVGEYHLLESSDFHNFVSHRLQEDARPYQDLRSKHFLRDSHNEIAIELLALKMRTKLSRLSDFTALHLFVTTLRCEHSCPYCQVSRQSEDKVKYDMTQDIADKALELVFKSPSPSIKIEFQGGEPLLNFEIIKYVVLKAKQINAIRSTNLDFVIATNLAVISNEILEFCRDQGVHISTSLDGPQDLHNKNRPRKGNDSYEKTIAGIKQVRDFLGKDQISALMTTTEASLGRVKEIIDEYVSNDFNGIFLRHLSPYGFAIKTKSWASYSTERWFEFYKEGLEYIIELNKNGIGFQEFYASIILKKMLTSEESGFVDLMNPAGIGIAACVYNYDGAVYASDESRMLAEMGDKRFKLGNVFENSYEEIFGGDALLIPLEESFTSSVPMCSDCAYEIYCGSEPVYHHAVHNDVVGRKPESSFCKRNMSIFEYLIRLMESDTYIKKLFQKWAN
jgi:uncharacterized protein